MKRIIRRASWLILSIGVLFGSTVCWGSVEPELITAIRHQNVQKVQTLLSEGANVNERDEGPVRTPLMWAAAAGNITIVESLLNHGAAVNAQDDFGKTALMLAIEKGHNQIARLLLAKGAKADVGKPGTTFHSSALLHKTPSRAAADRRVAQH